MRPSPPEEEGMARDYSKARGNPNSIQHYYLGGIEAIKNILKSGGNPEILKMEATEIPGFPMDIFTAQSVFLFVPGKEEEKEGEEESLPLAEVDFSEKDRYLRLPLAEEEDYNE